MFIRVRFLFLLMVVFFIGHRSVSLLSIMRTVSLVADEQLSVESQSLLYNYLSSAQKKKSIHEVVSDIKQIFPYLKTITVSHRPSKSLVKVIAHKPLCFMNDSYLLLENGEIVASDYFSYEKNSMLPSVYCAYDNNKEFLCVASQLIPLLPPDIQKQYTITIKDSSAIILHHKDDQFIMKCSLDSVLSYDLFNQCEKVKNYIAQQETYNKNRSWTVDMRFAHYIVAYRA